MSGFYADGEYDIAGFAVGVVEKKSLITSARVKVDDVLIGLPSSGLHSNGFSLVRKIVFDRMKFTGDEKFSDEKTLGEELLTPTRLYPKTILPMIKKFWALSPPLTLRKKLPRRLSRSLKIWALMLSC